MFSLLNEKKNEQGGHTPPLFPLRLKPPPKRKKKTTKETQPKWETKAWSTNEQPRQRHVDGTDGWMEKRARQRSSRASVRRAPWRGFDFSSEPTGAVDSHPSLRIGRRIEAVAGGPIWAVRGRPSFPFASIVGPLPLASPFILKGLRRSPFFPSLRPSKELGRQSANGHTSN